MCPSPVLQLTPERCTPLNRHSFLLFPSLCVKPGHHGTVEYPNVTPSTSPGVRPPLLVYLGRDSGVVIGFLLPRHHVAFTTAAGLRGDNSLRLGTRSLTLSSL